MTGLAENGVKLWLKLPFSNGWQGTGSIGFYVENLFDFSSNNSEPIFHDSAIYSVE